MKVEKARELGFCFGVRRAVRRLEKASREHSQIPTLGRIVHNQKVVDALAERGVVTVEDVASVSGNIISITAHGVGPEVLEEIRARGLAVIDTTCPIVRSAQKVSRNLAEAGFRVIIFGEQSHPEVKGLLSWAGKGAIATLDPAAVGSDGTKQIGIICQTTQSQSNFYEFVKQVLAATLPEAREVRIVNTICSTTRKRQEAAIDLAERSDLMIVVGGRDSANTRRLLEKCSATVTTHLVESASEISQKWLSGKERVGVTAGASTPDQAIDEVVARLQNLAHGQV